MIHAPSGQKVDAGIVTPSLVPELLASCAAQLLGAVPTSVERGTSWIGARKSEWIRFGVEGQASVELCLSCGRRWWAECECGREPEIEVDCT